jgi:hypothetical protein
MEGGLYTLNCWESVVVAVAGGAGAGDTGNGTAAAAVVVVVGVDSSVLEDASGAFGAVDARIGRDAVAAGLLLLLGVAIGPRSGSSQALVVCGTPWTGSYGYVSPRPEPHRAAAHAHLSELVTVVRSPHYTYL